MRGILRFFGGLFIVSGKLVCVVLRLLVTVLALLNSLAVVLVVITTLLTLFTKGLHWEIVRNAMPEFLLFLGIGIALELAKSGLSRLINGREQPAPEPAPQQTIIYHNVFIPSNAHITVNAPPNTLEAEKVAPCDIIELDSDDSSTLL